MTKKWFEDWIEVFKTGEHTDSTGNTQQWNESDIDSIVKNYNSNSHEAPIVLGHPKDNHPAYGWIEAVKREGDKLKIKLKKVVPEFIEWVEKGLYRKISVAISPDLGIKHVGFLGGVPPAIKGLQNAFSRNDETREYIINKGEKMKNTTLSGDFAEQIQDKNRQIEQLLSKQEKQEFHEFAQNLHQQGKIPAAYKEIIIDVLNSLQENSNCFSSQTHQKSTIASFKHFLSSLNRICETGELATKEKTPQGTIRLPDEDLGVRMANSLSR